MSESGHQSLNTVLFILQSDNVTLNYIQQFIYEVCDIKVFRSFTSFISWAFTYEQANGTYPVLSTERIYLYEEKIKWFVRRVRAIDEYNVYFNNDSKFMPYVLNMVTIVEMLYIWSTRDTEPSLNCLLRKQLDEVPISVLSFICKVIIPAVVNNDEIERIQLEVAAIERKENWYKTHNTPQICKELSKCMYNDYEIVITYIQQVLSGHFSLSGYNDKLLLLVISQSLPAPDPKYMAHIRSMNYDQVNMDSERYRLWTPKGIKRAVDLIYQRGVEARSKDSVTYMAALEIIIRSYSINGKFI